MKRIDEPQMKLMLRRMYLEILEANQSYQIMATTRGSEWIDIFNQFSGFFSPTWLAHRDVFFIKIHNLTTKSSKGANFLRIWQEIERIKPESKSKVSILRKDFDAQSAVLRRVWRACSKLSAHHELDATMEPIFWGEMPDLLASLKGLLTETGSLLGSSFMTFIPPNSGHTERLLERLR